MTGFKQLISGVGSNRATNWATTTAHCRNIVTVTCQHNNNCIILMLACEQCDQMARIFFIIGLLTHINSNLPKIYKN